MTDLIVPATVEHVEAIASRLRRADLQEIARISCMADPLTALLVSFTLSTEVYTWMRNGEPAAVFGVAPDPTAAGVGCPWFLGTDAMRENVRFFLIHSKVFAERWNRQFPLLENYVEPNNHLSIRWLKWCGFQFADPVPVGPNGELGLPFFKEL